MWMTGLLAPVWCEITKSAIKPKYLNFARKEKSDQDVKS
jgi:hypothetical protein